MYELKTIGGYAILVLIGVGYYVVSSRRAAGKRTKLITKTKARGSSVGEKSEKPLVEKPVKKKEKAKKPVSPETTPATWESAEPDNTEKEELSNKEFARQLSEKKAGTLLSSKSQADPTRRKSVKQSKAQEKQAVATPPTTASSSAAGDDADDDQSSTNSPELGATANDTPVSHGGISDMLEAPAAGPSVLKITAPTNPTQSRKTNAPAAFEPAETKKQRQNRKKAEQKKLEREADEKERKKLENEQRRTARIAEGRAAKDGSSFLASQAPSTSAWTPTKTNGNSTTASEHSQVDLLDTFDPPSNKILTPVESSEEGTSSSKAEWEKHLEDLKKNLPDEDEQQRLALEATAQWAVVENKKKKKAKDLTQKDVDEVIKKHDEFKEVDHKYYADNKASPPKPADSKIAASGQKYDFTTYSNDSDGKKGAEKTQEFQDSEWEV